MRWLLSLAVWAGIVAGLTARRHSAPDPVLEAWWRRRDAWRNDYPGAEHLLPTPETRDALRAIREAGGA